MAESQAVSTVVVSTTIVAFISGFMLGVYSIRGYLISPALVNERRANLEDPVESDQSDIDEDEAVLDHAPNWANGEEADRRQGLRAKARPAASTPAVTDVKEECKLVLVVRTDLGMTKGKIAAQCGHATLACYKSLLKTSARGSNGVQASILKKWEQYGQAKVAVQVKGEEEMTELLRKARSMGVIAEFIVDAGRTQIDPGSRTVLGVGPAPKSVVDKITGHLKLL